VVAAEVEINAEPWITFPFCGEIARLVPAARQEIAHDMNVINVRKERIT